MINSSSDNVKKLNSINEECSLRVIKILLIGIDRLFYKLKKTKIFNFSDKIGLESGN